MINEFRPLTAGQTAIFNKLVDTFPSIDCILADQLKLFIPKFSAHLQETPSRARNLQKMLKITTFPLEVNRLPRTDLIRTVFEAASLRILHDLPESRHLCWPDVSTLLEIYGQYPEFKDLSSLELTKLLQFRNMMIIALQIMPAKLEHLVDLVVRMRDH